MVGARIRSVIAPATLATLATFGACRAPTQAKIVIETSVPCSEIGTATLQIAETLSLARSSAPVATIDRCTNGYIGSMIAYPAGDSEGSFAVRVVVGLERSVEACVSAKGAESGCAVAEREGRFVPFETVVVPIHLARACAQSSCPAGTVCGARGACEAPTICATDADCGGTLTCRSGVCLGVASLSMGDGFSCAVVTDGSVRCWGVNDHGRLGLGDAKERGLTAGTMGATLPALDLGRGRRAKSLARFGMPLSGHACAILDDDTVKCWGENGTGALGVGDTLVRGARASEMGDALPAVAFPDGRHATQVTTGNRFTCARLDDASAVCWGSNASGVLGLENAAAETHAPTERVRLNGNRVRQIAAGFEHACVLLEDGRVKCWGDNTYGQLGLGDSRARGAATATMGDALPVVMLGAGRIAKAVYANGTGTCAVLDDASVKCWGDNTYGQLGLGDTRARGAAIADMSELPAIPLGGGEVAALGFVESTDGASTTGAATCAVLEGGLVKCWGSARDGMLGTLAPNNVGDEPGEVTALAPLAVGGATRAIAGGGRSVVCALLDSQRIRCGGKDHSPQQGVEGAPVDVPSSNRLTIVP